MNNSQRKNRVLSIVLAVLMFLSCVMLSACSKENGELTFDITGENTADMATSVEDVPDSSVSVESDSDSVSNSVANGSGSNTSDIESQSSVKLKSEYKPYTAFDENGNEKAVDFVYGTGYSAYGGSLCFLNDGTFTAYIGISADNGSRDGSYQVVSDTEIKLSFNNGTEGVATITETANGYATEIHFVDGLFEVVFR